MKKAYLVNPLTVKSIDYSIDNDTVTIQYDGHATAIIIDNFLKHYYHNNGKLPMFEKYVIEKPNSILMFDKLAFYKNLPCQTLGSLVKLGLIDFTIDEK